MNWLKRKYVELFSEVMPTHKYEEGDDYWIYVNDSCSSYSYNYQKVVKNRFGVWKLEKCWLHRMFPLQRIGGER